MNLLSHVWVCVCPVSGASPTLLCPLAHSLDLSQTLKTCPALCLPLLWSYREEQGQVPTWCYRAPAVGKGAIWHALDYVLWWRSQVWWGLGEGWREGEIHPALEKLSKGNSI